MKVTLNLDFVLLLLVFSFSIGVILIPVEPTGVGQPQNGVPNEGAQHQNPSSGYPGYDPPSSNASAAFPPKLDTNGKAEGAGYPPLGPPSAALYPPEPQSALSGEHGSSALPGKTFAHNAS